MRLWSVYASMTLMLFSPQGISGQEQLTVLPVSWLDGQVRITLSGVFLATEETIEGTVARDELQYKLLIQYENTSNTEYYVESIKSAVGIGFTKLVTQTGSIYSPKYVGGGIPMGMKPRQRYSTHLYAFNIPKDEKPTQLLIYQSKQSDVPQFRVSIDQLIAAPLPSDIHVVSIDEDCLVGDYMIRLTDVLYPTFVVKGPFAGNRYGLYSALNGYQLICVSIEFTNSGKRTSDAPLFSGDGDPEIEGLQGRLFPSIDDELTYTSFDHRLVRQAYAKDLFDYPIINSYAKGIRPSESTTILPVFEIKGDDKASYIRLKLVGDVHELRFRIMD